MAETKKTPKTKAEPGAQKYHVDENGVHQHDGAAKSKKAEPIEFVPGELEAAMKHNHQVAFWAHRQREIADEAKQAIYFARAKGDKATIKAVTDDAATKRAAAELATESSGTALTRALRAAEAVGENNKIIGELTTYRDYFGDANYRDVSVYNRSWNEDENLYPNDLVLVPKPYDSREVQPDILNGRASE